ncbi:hypothetical protein K0M31_008654 [Melipona bicolor]|uniref:Uncharacterized protein n=1 Tax=Melipona bicolor TaxID=60889 RepID=A0AA40FPL7_9HYME|nr:hypothetical protein K0M31_008654 [Melipona bicolor]
MRQSDRIQVRPGLKINPSWPRLNPLGTLITKPDSFGGAVQICLHAKDYSTKDEKAKKVCKQPKPKWISPRGDDVRERNEGTNEAMSRQNEGTEELGKKDRKGKGEKRKASDNGVIKGGRTNRLGVIEEERRR